MPYDGFAPGEPATTFARRLGAYIPSIATPEAVGERLESAPGGSVRAGGSFYLRYIASGCFGFSGTDAAIARFSLPRWAGSTKDILYLTVCGYTIRRIVRSYVSNLASAYREQAEAKLELVGRLAMAAEYRDDETGGYDHRIARTAQIERRPIGMDEEFCERLPPGDRRDPE